MTFKRAVTSLAKSVLAGGAIAALAGAAVVAILTVPFVESLEDAGQLARLLGGVAAFAFGMVLAGAFLLGLPTTFVLQRLNRESEAAYVVAGATFGFLLAIVPVILDGDASGYSVSILGAASGMVAGRVWWRTYRKHVAEAE